MNYKSKAVPVEVQQVIYSDVSKLEGVLYERYCVDTRHRGGKVKLREQYGSTTVDSGDWLVEFPNGEVHVVRDERFKQRFEHVNVYTPEEVKNAISMAKLLATMGGESS